jgi:hypothetical protein
MKRRVNGMNGLNLDGFEVCECGHPSRYHDKMGLSENLIVVDNCNACQCREFKQSIPNTQDEIIRLREEIKARKEEVERILIAIGNELSQLRERCEHPNKESHPGYSSPGYLCSDCGKSWSNRW